MNPLELRRILKELVKTEINNLRLSEGQWHLGEVTSIINNKKVAVKIDGSSFEQEVSCNPDISLVVGDYVWVIFINGDSKNKFVISRRAV